MEDFPNAYVYCQQLKELFDQLKNVGAPVSNNCLVLQMVVDLTKAYNGATVNLKKLVSRRRLQPAGLSPWWLITLMTHFLSKNSHQNQNTHGGKKGQNHNNSGKKNGGNHGGIKSSGGGGCNGCHNSGWQQQSGQQQSGHQQWPTEQWQWPWMPWALPPCPYPSSNAPPPPYIGLGPIFSKPNSTKQASLGQNHHRHTATVAPPTPTNIEAMMHTFGLNPLDANWYMDIGATSRMTLEQGNLSSYFNLSNTRGLIVANGHSIAIRGYGHTNLSPTNPSSTLKNDFQTRIRLMRCESRGDLYPITTNQATSPSTFSALAPSLWHARKYDGVFEKHKACLVGDDKTQQVGVDGGETFSPVVKLATIRIVLSLAISKAWSIHQLDVKNVFLY
ncbi:uncharacterized protein [Glycine max]|uniref:uncharacterized protein n=1 Tax=Glycine max TaxID=3847 RepID=UPI0007193B83|nr:uncharacterized protein LOC102662318 [Glycine max]|eukprot:XP_006605176.2 uncharacterized protein LOC102662318 [Glycine max]